jgi:sugar lactone lactonase YvrE
MMQEPQVLVAGRGLVEAPRWHDGRLYFSDWSAGEVIAADPGYTEVVARVPSLPLCGAWLPDGLLLIVASADGRLLRREPDGSLVTHADLDGSGWNDIVVDGRGNAYVKASASTWPPARSRGRDTWCWSPPRGRSGGSPRT